MKRLTRALLRHFDTLKRHARLRSRPKEKPTRHPRARPCLLRLEERCVPAAIAWTGNVDNDWGTAGNWQGGAKPGVDDVAVFNNNVSCDLSATASVGGVDLQAA